MSSDLSAYLGNKIVRWLGGNAMPSAPSGLWIALYDGDPKSGGSDVTTTINAGGRVEATFTVPSSGTTNQMDSDADVDFGNAAGDADVSHFAVFDASTSGNFLASDVVAGGPFSILTGQPVMFTAGDLTFKIGSP